MTPAQQNAVNYYINNKSRTKDQAIGIVAVLSSEAGPNLVPTIENNTGTETGGVINPNGSFGLAQWNGARQQGLLNYCNKYGKDSKLVNTQLDYILTEAADSYKDFWTAILNPSTTYQDMIAVMVDTYEVPKDKVGEIARATTYAVDMYQNLVPKPTPPPSPSPTPSTVTKQIALTLTIDSSGNVSVTNVTIQ